MGTPTPPSEPPVDATEDPVYADMQGDSIADLAAEPVIDPIADPIPAPELPVPGLETPPAGPIPMPPMPAPLDTVGGATILAAAAAVPVTAAPLSSAEYAAAEAPPAKAQKPKRPPRELPAISTVGPISGIFFVALFLISFMTLSTPEPDESNRVWTSFWEDSGNRAQGMTASIAMMLAAITFLWLVGAFRRRLAPAIGTDAFYASGIAGGVLMFVAGLGAGIIPLGYALADVPIPDDADVIRLVDGLYYGTLFLPLPYALAGFLIPLFFALRGQFLLPRWLEFATLVVGVICLTGPALFVVPHVLFMLWTIAVSVTLLLRERELPPAPPVSL